MLKRSFASCSVFVSVAFSALPGSAANFGVTEKFWGNATTIGSFAWAIDRANATAGRDTISLFTDVSIDDYQGSLNRSFRLADITDGLHCRIGDQHRLAPDQRSLFRHL